MKKAKEVMEILEAYDLTGSLRGAAKLAGCDHKTVAHWVRQRELAAGLVPVTGRSRPAMAGTFIAKIDELVERSGGKIRADVAHGKLVAIGYEGRSAPQGGGSPRRSAATGVSMGAGPGRGSRSPGCGCSGTTVTGR